MMFWKRLRQPILAITFGSTLLVLGRLLLLAPQSQSQAKSPQLPIHVLLPGWQSLSSEPLENPPGATYRYKQGNRELTIEMRYLTQHVTNQGVFSRYDPAKILPDRPAPMIRHQDRIGFYSLSVEQGRAYLRSCINPRGEGVITFEQFIQNRYIADIQPERFLLWLMGQETLRDYRCLWAHLSVPLKNTTPDQAYQILEKNWTTWYKWWHTNFPKQ